MFPQFSQEKRISECGYKYKGGEKSKEESTSGSEMSINLKTTLQKGI